jgi:hypothetical protein
MLQVQMSVLRKENGMGRLENDGGVRFTLTLGMVALDLTIRPGFCDRVVLLGMVAAGLMKRPTLGAGRVLISHFQSHLVTCDCFEIFWMLFLMRVRVIVITGSIMNENGWLESE